MRHTLSLSLSLCVCVCVCVCHSAGLTPSLCCVPEGIYRATHTHTQITHDAHHPCV